MSVIFRAKQRVSRYWVLLLAVALLGACAAERNTGLETQAVGIVKSPNDRREYRAVVLENGLRVILVSDPETDKAAAAMDVAAGSNSDPAEYPGLAHFLEHMLFLGTEKFPGAGEYPEYISSHGGSHNAYTAYENTNYYFDIEADYLEGALARFSQFFIAPLFTAEYVDRERNAVHSEYQSNLRDDGRRAYSIFKEVINQEHPLSRFSVGSLETLADDGTGSLRRALLSHYENHYSANLMSLTILGAQSLDELEALARRYFTAVPDRGMDAPSTGEPLFEAGSLPALLRIEPVRDTRSLSYTFPIPVARTYYKSKPVNFLANLIGHEGKGSLLSLLREKGWANGLSAGLGLSYRDNATFSVTVSLTEEGAGKVDEITGLVFQFIERVRREGIQRRLFEEQRRMAEIAFLFQEPARPIGYVSSLARRLREYPPAEVLTAGYAYENFDPELIRRFLSYLRPDNVLLTLNHQGVETDRVDPEFGGEFSLRPITPERISAWLAGGIDEALAIAEPNPFLPEDLSIKPYAGPPSPGGAQDKPDLIVERDGIRLWFKQDNEFQVPRANFYLYALTPAFNESLTNSLLARFAVSLVNDQLNEFSYPARLAGISYGVSTAGRGFTIRIGGYDDKQPVLLEEVLKTLVSADFQQSRFDIIKAEMIRRWENAGKRTPYARLFEKIQALLVSPYWSEEERIEAARSITLEQVKAFVPTMLRDIRIHALYHGNAQEPDALAMMDRVTAWLHPSAAARRPPFGTVVNLAPGDRVIQEVEVEHEDSAIVIYLQGPDDSLETRATVNLLSALLRAPFFDSLRTEKQLGYVVNAGTMPILNTNGLVFYIESPGTDPIALEGHIDAFLGDYQAEVAVMPAAVFADVKAGLLNNLRQKPQRLGALSGRFWGDIVIEEYQRDSTLAMADAVEALSQADILAYYRAHVAGPDAARLVSRSVGQPHRESYLAARAANLAGARVLKDHMESYNAFKQDAEVFIFRPSR